MRSDIWKPWFILSYSTILFEFQNFYGVEGNAKTLSHGMARTPGFGKWCPDLLQYIACALVSDTKATHKNTSQDSGQPNPDEIWTQNIQNTPRELYTHIWEVPPGRMLIIWWSQYPQSQHTFNVVLTVYGWFIQRFNENILICVQVCDCPAHNEPFRTHYFKYREDFLMMAPMEYRNMYEILCICCVNIPVQVRLNL